MTAPLSSWSSSPSTRRDCSPPTVLTLTFVVTLAAYELLIRRTPPLRALFGLRLRPASA